MGACRLPVVNPANNQEYNLEFQVVKKGVVPILGAAAALEMGIISLHPDKIFMHSIQHTRTGPTSRLKRQACHKGTVNQALPSCLSGQDRLFARRVGVRFKRKRHTSPDNGTASPYRHEAAANTGTRTFGRVGNYWEDWWTNRMDLSNDCRTETRWQNAYPQALNKALKRSVHPVPTVEQLLPDLSRAKVFSKCNVKHGFGIYNWLMTQVSWQPLQCLSGDTFGKGCPSE